MQRPRRGCQLSALRLPLNHDSALARAHYTMTEALKASQKCHVRNEQQSVSAAMSIAHLFNATAF